MTFDLEVDASPPGINKRSHLVAALWLDVWSRQAELVDLSTANVIQVKWSNTGYSWKDCFDLQRKDHMIDSEWKASVVNMNYCWKLIKASASASGPVGSSAALWLPASESRKKEAEWGEWLMHHGKIWLQLQGLHSLYLSAIIVHRDE